MSKLTMWSESSSVSWFMHWTKWVEFLTNDSVQPTCGDKILAISLASWYVGEPVVETIGRSATFSLRIFDSAHIWGNVQYWGVRYCL